MSNMSRGLVFSSEVAIGSVPPDVGATLDKSRYKNNGTFTNVSWVQLPYGVWVMSFNGSSSKITLSKVTPVIKTAIIWVYVSTLNRSIVGFDGGTHSIETTAGSLITATGWSAPTIYINGAVTSQVVLNSWRMITVTSTTGFIGSAVIFGQAASFFAGNQLPQRLYSYTMTPENVSKQFESDRRLFGV